MKQWNSLKILFFAASMIFTLNASAVDAPITDAVIIAKIESKIALDPSLSIFKISISSDNGIVKLSGHVNSDSDAAAAVQIAQSTDGVTDVDGSGLIIKQSTNSLADTLITAKVKGEFIRHQLSDSYFSASGINVETTNGVVSLGGSAKSQEDADRAVKIAESVSHVSRVISRITVNSDQ